MARKRQLPSGTVYLLHFNAAYKHAAHYIGWTIGDVEDRLQQHMSGTGARLIEVIVNAGHTFELARTWQGTTELERALKRYGGAARICPICNPAGAMTRAQFKRGMKPAREWVRNRGELKHTVDDGLGFASGELDIELPLKPAGADGDHATLYVAVKPALFGLGRLPYPNLRG